MCCNECLSNTCLETTNTNCIKHEGYIGCNTTLTKTCASQSEINEDIYRLLDWALYRISTLETIIGTEPIDMGTLTCNTAAYVNLPPSQVGDNTITTLNRTDKVLTLAMFTTETTPVYADPEGDPVNALRVDTLPVLGTLLLNGNAVVVGDIIDVADINSGLFVYSPPDQNEIATASFEFSLRDAGSNQFSS